MALLQFKNLSKRYEKDKQVLSNINMEVNKGSLSPLLDHQVPVSQRFSVVSIE